MMKGKGKKRIESKCKWKSEKKEEKKSGKTVVESDFFFGHWSTFSHMSMAL